MAATRRRQILEVFRTRLLGIKTVDGFNTNAGDLVFLGETPVLGPDDTEPVALAVVVLTDDVIHSQENVKTVLPIEIQAITKPNAHEQSQPWLLVEDVIGDVKTAIETSDRTLGGLLSHQRDIRRGPTRFLERESGDDIIAAGITYIVEFVEGWGAPA